MKFQLKNSDLVMSMNIVHMYATVLTNIPCPMSSPTAREANGTRMEEKVFSYDVRSVSESVILLSGVSPSALIAS